MMKFLMGFCILAIVATAVFSLGNPEIPTEWIDLSGDCLTAMRNQIQKEIVASYQYLAMGAYFSRNTVNRPGFAKQFFEAAREERDLASKLIEYLSIRGQFTDGITDLIRTPTIQKDEWESGVDALEDALNMETELTKSIRRLIATCEKYKNYHLVDYLTGVFLKEQLHGQRDLAEKVHTLKKMMKNHCAFGEFWFDKDL